jgi:hypothetical protein
MMQAVHLDRWRRACAWPVLIGSALAAGCAGGAWLESPIEAELPIDPPKHGYPTALPSASMNAPAVNAPVTPAPQASPQPAYAESSAHPAQSQASQHQQPTQQPSPQQYANQQRLDRQQPLRPSLAVIPPQYVHSPPSTSPVPAPATNPSTASSQAPPSSAASFPQLDLSFLDTLASSPVTQPNASSSSNPTTTDVASHATSTKSTVQLASAESSESPTQRHERLEKSQAALIEALETEIRHRREASPSDDELPRLEQQLRLVYAAAGRLDDAVSVIDSLDPSQREAYKNLMFGLGVWLSPDEARRAPLRTAKVLHSLRDATSDLTASSKLELKNLTFCERVDQFGWYSEFPRKEFQPKQQVILYAEVENFAAEQKGPAGYETELQGAYVILDSSGQEIASRQLQLDKEVCRNHRRDYFLAYRIYLPDNIPPGRYRLELTVEDLKARGKYQGRKLGEGVIEFTIR